MLTDTNDPLAALPDKLRIVAKYLDDLDDHWEADQNASIPLIPVSSSRWAQGQLREIAASLAAAQPDTRLREAARAVHSALAREGHSTTH